jgi:hypothetical protein
LEPKIGSFHFIFPVAQPAAAATILKVKRKREIKPKKIDNEMADYP